MIVTLTAICLVALTLFVFREWNHENPILDLRLLKQRNFATAVLMMFVLGMVLFGTTVLIPQFLQVQMGYSAQEAGMALSMGAIVLVFMMPLVGQLVTRVDPRLLVAIGFLGTAAALYHMTILNMQIDFRTAAMLRVYQVIGLAFIFIPINTLSYVGMPPNKSNQIAGMTNLFRNLGGGIGISLLSTYLQRLGQKHQVYLSAHTGPGDLLFQQRVDGLTRNFTNQGFPAGVAQTRAYAVIERIIYGQATTLAYIDVISAMAVGILCMVPLVLIMKRPQRGAKPVAAH